MDATLRNQVRDRLFEARMSAKYHESRQKSFSFWARAFKFISAFSATSVFFAIQDLSATLFGVPAKDLATNAALILGIVQFIDFFAGFDQVAGRHSEKRRGFLEFETEAVKLLLNGANSNEVSILVEKANRLESDEGPVVGVLLNRAFNQQLKSQTRTGENVPKKNIQSEFWVWGWLRSGIPL